MANEPEVQVPDSAENASDHSYYTSATPAGSTVGNALGSWIAIPIAILVIPLLVAVAVAGRGGSGGGAASPPCSAASPENAAACATTTTRDTTPIDVPGDPVSPTTTVSGGGPLPPVRVSPPPASPSPPPSFNPSPPPAPPSPPAPPPPPAPAPPPSPTPPPPPPAYSGAPKLTRSDGGQALFTLPNAAAGKTVSRCETIRYNGNPSARVRLYGTWSGTGLENYVDLKIIRGTASSTKNGACTNFKADSTNYLGQGKGVMFNGLLAAFPATYESAPDEPTQADRERWTNGEKHTYRFEVKLRSDNAAQGLGVSFQLHWQARSY